MNDQSANRTSTQFVIYSLTDPRTGEIRYVGRSSSGLTRARWHEVAPGWEKNKGLAAWITDLKLSGLAVETRILSVVERVDLLDEEERGWIAVGRVEGWPLFNLTSGGAGAPDPVPELRARLSASHLGKKLSPEHRAKLSAARMGIVYSDETREKMRQAKLGKKQSEETKAKRAAKLRGQTRSEETKAKMRAARALQAPITEEARERMRAAQRARFAREAAAKVAAEAAAEAKV